MFNKLKKIISILVIAAELVCFVQIAHAEDWSYTIDTDNGPVTLVLPEGKTFEEGYIEMAKLYLGERADYEKLLAETEDLIAKAKEYEDAVAELQKLQDELAEKNEELNTLYKKVSKGQALNFIITAGISTDLSFNKPTKADVGFGIEILHGWIIMVEASYPLEFTFKTGMRF